VSTITTPADAARQELRGFRGTADRPRRRSLRRGAEGLQNAMIDKRPALIAQWRDPGRRRGDDRLRPAATTLILAVRGGGHKRRRPRDVRRAGVVIDLSPMKGIQIRSEGRATVARGRAAARGARSTVRRTSTGFATPSGIISTTGVGGLTLGGGPRAPDAQVRAHDRQPARGGARAGETASAWRASADENADPLLGDQGRRRQLRRRHVVPLPAARCGELHRRPDVLGRSRPAEEVLSAYREFLPAAPARAERLLRLRHGAAGAALSRRRSTCARCAASSGAYVGSEEDGREGDRAVPRVGVRAAHARGRPGAARRPAGRVRRAVTRPGTSGTGAPDFVKEIPDGGRRDPRAVRRAAADDEVDDATCTRSTARRTTSVHPRRRGAIAMRNGARSSRASIPIRPTSRRSGSGRSTTSRRCNPYLRGRRVT